MKNSGKEFLRKLFIKSSHIKTDNDVRNYVKRELNEALVHLSNAANCNYAFDSKWISKEENGILEKAWNDIYKVEEKL